MIKPPFGDKPNNIIVYNMENGVCYEAINDIKVGEELLALFADYQSKQPGDFLFTVFLLLQNAAQKCMIVNDFRTILNYGCIS